MFNPIQIHLAGSAWSQKVRRVASDCHALLNADFVDLADYEQMFDRIDSLRRELVALRHRPLIAWIDNLRDALAERVGLLDDSTVITA